MISREPAKEVADEREAEGRLVKEINANRETGKISEARLETDDRILARITDGIYRQPASALRELIANAYDADAQHVYIKTDAPRFEQISVRDDGNGMTVEALARLIHHIGGSAKRIPEGAGFGVANRDDASLSPKGRRLIGKIGIGLFSVSQLTRQFQIITKVKGATHRLVAEVVLRTYTEDELASTVGKGRGKVETGTVRIKTVAAEDKEAHGTEIILMSLRPQTRDLLQSSDVWRLIDASKDPKQGDSEPRSPPRYHIGRVERSKHGNMLVDACLPWDNDDAPESRFGKLYQAIIDELDDGDLRPSLEASLDNYLRTLWTLSLSAPINYIGPHPFDLTGSDEPIVFELSNAARGQATRLKLKGEESVRDRLKLCAPERGKSNSAFNVFVDDIQLLRPIRFSELPTTLNVIRDPLLFVGKDSPDLSKIPKEERGGDLAFEAYFLWTPKVVPKEHAGLLVRISDASGTLFDEAFLKYQVAEQTRLRQITAEIFVSKGLDAALNIDRESFNFAHPHYQYLMKWVHRALRQLANAQKMFAAELNKVKSARQHQKQILGISKAVEQELSRIYDQRDEEFPEVVFAASTAEAVAARRSGSALAFDKSIVFADLATARRPGNDQERFEERIRAVAQILEAYGAFRGMKYERQQSLLRAIVAVFAAVGGV